MSPQHHSQSNYLAVTLLKAKKQGKKIEMLTMKTLSVYVLYVWIFVTRVLFHLACYLACLLSAKHLWEEFIRCVLVKVKVTRVHKPSLFPSFQKLFFFCCVFFAFAFLFIIFSLFLYTFFQRLSGNTDWFTYFFKHLVAEYTHVCVCVFACVFFSDSWKKT